MAAEAGGPGRRLTPEQEARGAELFAAGASEREVADAVGCSASTAHRLRERIAAEHQPVVPAVEDQDDDAVLEAADGIISDEQLVLLEAERDRLAGEHVKLQARAEASLAAGHSLVEERDRLLLTTGDASPVRQRLIDAENDHRDWVRAIELTLGHISEIDSRIAELTAGRELAVLRAQLDAAVAERAGVVAGMGERQRAAVTAVQRAAEDFVATFAEETAARGRVAVLAAAVMQRALQLGEPGPAITEPQPTTLSVTGGTGPELALNRAIFQARRGDVAAVAGQLGLAFGWSEPVPPTEEELEQWRRITADRQRQAEELKAAQAAGPHVDPGEPPGPVALDHFGYPVDRFGNRLVPRGSLPNPRGVLEFPDAPLYGPTIRTGW